MHYNKTQAFSRYRTIWNLEEYAMRNGFSDITHLTDDGYSGTRWDRPAFLKMTDAIESGSVTTILVKDMSRLGRDHLRVGLFLEQLREKGVRLIAVAEGIDTERGEDDFMPFRNIIAEWHARDTSRKTKAIFAAKTAQGKRVSGAIIYGYIKDPADKQKWILDREAAEVVQRIYRSVIEGKTVTQIAEGLTQDGIPTPTVHWARTGAKMPKPKKADPCKWAAATIISILGREEYKGVKILNKTVKESYKDKKAERDKLTAECTELTREYKMLKEEVKQVERIRRGMREIVREENRREQPTKRRDRER